jgi:hypothetical protein
MTSDVGILKIGIADDPLFRMKAVKKVYPIITGFYRAWGMPRRQAEFVERMVHRRLVSFRHENELFRMTEVHAVNEIETVINTLDIRSTPFSPLPAPVPKVRKKRQRPLSPREKMIINLRIEPELRRDAERAAQAVDRTFSNWVVYLMACEVAALERGEPPASHLPREEVMTEDDP